MTVDNPYLLIAIFGISGITIYVLGKLHIPSMLGFPIGGIALGPSGLNILRQPHEVEVLAEIGHYLSATLFRAGWDRVNPLSYPVAAMTSIRTLRRLEICSTAYRNRNFLQGLASMSSMK